MCVPRREGQAGGSPQYTQKAKERADQDLKVLGFPVREQRGERADQQP